LNRYRLKAVSIGAFRPYVDPSLPPPGPYDLGGAWVGNPDYFASPDPLLSNDATARNEFVVAIVDESFGQGFRGGFHAWPNYFCDLRPESEYPGPDVIGTPANHYTVPPSRSGDGASHDATYYSEDPTMYGLVRPIQDYMNCPNFCRRSDCFFDINHDDPSNIGPHAGCFRDMDAPGDDPAGRHMFDMPGMRCADGYEREINACDFWKGMIEDLDPANGSIIDGLPMYVHLHAQRFGTDVNTSYNIMREGWRWEEHYWSKGQKVRTCALEAQERTTGIVRKDSHGNPISCEEAIRKNDSYYIGEPSCGCGPKGAYCEPTIPVGGTFAESRTEHNLLQALQSEPIQLITSIVDRDADYLSLLTTKQSTVNGPLAWAFTYQANIMRAEGFVGITPPAAPDPAWNIPYESTSWVDYVRPDRHSGVLTTTEYLVRFPTARARIARYRRAFLCSTEFDYPPKPDPKDTNPDISKRNGCSTCHSVLEPEGLWFARYPDRTGLYLDPAEYPLHNAACKYCFENGGQGCMLGDNNPGVPGGVVTDGNLLDSCAHYVDAADGTPGAAYRGALKPLIYRDPTMESRVDLGPAGMVARDMASGAIQQCAVRRAFQRLMRREPTADELNQALNAFESNGRSYRDLINAVVTNDAYRSEP
jgi:hypothetical protein